MITVKFNSKYVLVGLVSLTTFLVYIPSLQNNFISWWDDGQYVLDNYHIRLLNMAFFKWAFFSFYENNWHPLTWISHALDYAFWGMNPLGHHLTNVLLHTVNTALVMLLIIRLLDTANEMLITTEHPALLERRTILIAAGTAGFLFGLHPVHVQSVAWVAERKDVLCALFFLLSILSYIHSLKNEATSEKYRGKLLFHFFNKYYLMSLGLFILALLSKPMAVSLPLVLLIVDWYPFNRMKTLAAWMSTVLEKLPFFVMSILSSILTVLAQKEGGALDVLGHIGLSTRLRVAIEAIISYLGKMLWPLNLSPYYPYPKHLSLSFEFFIAVVLVLGITAVSIVMVNKQRLWLAAWSYYIVTLAPVLGIVQVGGQSMADRYLYLPSIGPLLVASLGVALMIQWMNFFRYRHLVAKAFCTVLATIVFASLLYLTIEQLKIWRNSITFWSYIIDKDPGKFSKAYNNRGVAYTKNDMMEHAIDDFNRAIAIDPSLDEAFYSRGIAYDKMGNNVGALEDFNRAIALDPLYFEAFLARGQLYEKMGEVDKAIDDINKAIMLNPAFDKAYFSLGVLYAQRGMVDEAVTFFNSAISINPNYYESYINRAVINSLKGRQELALQDFNKALLIDHADPAGYLNRGNFYLNTGKKDLALADFKKACDLGDNEGCRSLYQLSNPDIKH